MLSPHTCFVLDDGNGRPVGYIIGTPNTTEFAERFQSVIIPIVDPKLVPKDDQPGENETVRGLKKSLYAGEVSMLQKHDTLLEKYPAHLHIDLLPEFQKQGWGQKMIGMFLNKMKELGVSGVHLGMVKGNEGARRFYERLEWKLCEDVLDGGASGEAGREGDAVCLLKDIV